MHMRIYRIQWRKLGKALLIVLVVYVVSQIYLHASSFMEEAYCSEKESQSLIEETCRLYKEKRLVGDLCPHLCKWKNIEYKHCTNYHTGKRVLFVNCRNFCETGVTIPAVLKMAYGNYSDLQYTEFGFDTEEETSTPSIKNLQLMIRDRYTDKLDLDIPESDDPVAVAWHWNYRDYYDSSDRRSMYALARSVWSLVMQTEYLVMRANQELDIFPRIYGTCGGVYLVESSPPGDIMTSVLLITRFPWAERAELAKKILHVVRVMDTGLHKPLHMCDVKEENFGVGRQNQMKIIDADSVFFETEMMKVLDTKMEDCDNGNCDFFDCLGFCNASKKQCMPIRLNNNLQTVCRDVFLGHMVDTMGGLLRDPPRSVKAPLKSVLRECAYSRTFENGMPMQQPGDDIYWSIYNLLQKSIDSEA